MSDSLVSRRQWLKASAIAACFAQFSGFDAPLLGGTKAPKKSAPDETHDDLPATEAVVAETFEFDDEKRKPQEIIGQVLLEGADKSLLIQGIDSRIWQVSAGRLKKRTVRQEPFSPISKQDLGTQLVRELGPGFSAHTTKHYVLCTNTSDLYARLCGTLLERLAKAFFDYWRNAVHQCEIVIPQFPLIALIFEQQKQFAEFATTDVGPDLATVPGYFSILTNRVVVYDFAFDKRAKAPKSVEEIQQRLEAVSYNVATMIHEATHQLAFNCGLHTRLADNPLWLTEGMAMFFETPDLKSKTGWKTAGQLNKPRLARWKKFQTERREEGRLTKLIRNDELFTTAETAEDAYAESWALTYFLIRKKPAAYVDYLTFLAAKKPLDYPTPDQRVNEFEAVFGEVQALDAEFLRYLKTLR
jgi:hypothetical protein